MASHLISESSPLPPAVLRRIADASPPDEISNFPGAVRHHVFRHGGRDEATGRLGRPMLFFVYQTARHGPQNGFRLCLVRRGYRIASGVKAEGGAEEDEIDRLEKEIPQGLREFVVLGEVPSAGVGEEEGMEGDLDVGGGEGEGEGRGG